ncbi:hypothetical protein ABK040_002339 [Willaertia magna]
MLNNDAYQFRNKLILEKNNTNIFKEKLNEKTKKLIKKIYLFVSNDELLQLSNLFKKNLKLIYSKNKTLQNFLHSKKNLNKNKIVNLLEDDDDRNKLLISQLINPKIKQELLKAYSNFDKVPEGYPNLKQLKFIYKNFKKNNKDIVKILRLTKKEKTAEGRNIYGIKISENVTNNQTVTNQQYKTNILIVGLHHARELNTVITTLYIMERILRDKKLRNEILQKYNLYFIPVLNVDGYNYVFTKNNWWRKNRRIVNIETVKNQTVDISYNDVKGLISKFNEKKLTESELINKLKHLKKPNLKIFKKKIIGVDLNRNYPLGFGKCGGDINYNSDCYKGEFPFSEVETRVIRNLTKKLNFAKVLDFHSFGRHVLTGYTCTKNVQQEYISKLGKELADKIEDYHIRAPSADGEHQEYQITRSTSYAFLIELGTSFQPPLNDSISESRRVFPLVETFLRKDIPLIGIVKDSESKSGIKNVKINVLNIKWTNGEFRRSGRNGLYHLFLQDGLEYDIEFIHKKYERKVIKVLIEKDKSIIVDVELTKLK